MRDIAVTLIVLAGCCYTLQRPYIGILLWSWLSYMNPHRLAYGFAYSAPFAYVTAIVLVFSLIISRDKKSLPINTITITWLFFVGFMGITTVFAFFPDDALIQYIKVIKIQLIVFLTMMLITDMQKLRLLIWVIVLSIGYYSVKGGVFTLLTGGGFHVWGPAGSFIEDNNALAVAVLMLIPLMNYLRETNEKIWVRQSLLIAMIASLFTVLGSQSRGALIAIMAVGILYWVKSKHKAILSIIMPILAVALLAFMPDSWYQRMETIKSYEEDGSAMGRLNAWEYAYHAANDNLFGVGFESWSYKTFAMYAPNPLDVHAAHSIYFSVLADHGWIGLVLFLLIYFLTWKKLSRLIIDTNSRTDLQEINLLSRMLQVSFVAYFVGGAFLSLSYFDLPWHLVSFVVLLSEWVRSHKTTV